MFDLGSLNVVSAVRTAIVGAMLTGIAGGTAAYASFPEDEDPPTPSFVADNGWLRVEGTQLVNFRGEAIQLKGVSSHGLQWWEGRYANGNAMRWLRDNWKINVFRLAMYTVQGGYVENRSVGDKVIQAVDAALNLGIYVVIDWHILLDGDPSWHKETAKQFFAAMSQRYKDNPGVLYEICNEPNGQGVSFKDKIKPYAEEVIPVIRQNSPKSVIIVGTGTWSQDVHEVADAPLAFANVMYSLHFYAGSHTGWLRDRVAGALARNVPIFVTEWGTSAADGLGGNYFDEADRWVQFLDSKGISMINWSLTDKNESSSILRPGAASDGWWGDNNFSPSGFYVRRWLLAQPGQRQFDAF